MIYSRCNGSATSTSEKLMKIFRKQRFKLAAESRFAKYLRYAIGEILLVVIGILIALQVNNWNETRKSKLQEKVYEQQLYKEFISDSLSLDHSIALNQSKIEDEEYILKYFRTKPAVIDTNHFVINSLVAGRSVTFQPYLPTYNELVSTGQVGIISNKKLMDFIRRYVRKLNDLRQFSETDNQEFKKIYSQHLFRYISPVILSHFWLIAENKKPGTIDLSQLHISRTHPNITGFLKDPESFINTRNIKASDMEQVQLYKKAMKYYIRPILALLRREISKKE
ncbi:MAG: hypothetical protein JXR71_07980 [Bacteroidales bacterium]|nr:hypothetical protein [Bacteroidales bacterium]